MFNALIHFHIERLHTCSKFGSIYTARILENNSKTPKNEQVMYDFQQLYSKMTYKREFKYTLGI